MKKFLRGTPPKAYWFHEDLIQLIQDLNRTDTGSERKIYVLSKDGAKRAISVQSFLAAIRGKGGRLE